GRVLAAVRAGVAVVGEVRAEAGVRRRAQELLVTDVVVHEALQPGEAVLGDRGVGDVRGEVARVAQLEVGRVQVRVQALVHRDGVCANRGGDVVLGTDDECGHLHTDRKSTRLNSSHVSNSYAGFCLKKKS